MDNDGLHESVGSHEDGGPHESVGPHEDGGLHENIGLYENDIQDAELYERVHKGRRHRHSRKRWLISPFWVVAVLEGFVIAGLAMWCLMLNDENEEHLVNETRLAQTIKDNKKELEGLKWDFNEVKHNQQKSCLPNLLPLKLDQVVSVNLDYIKSALFTLSGKKDSRYLDYKIVLQNTTQSELTPQFEILFFSVAGNQVGSSTVGYGKDDTTKGEVLEKAETRSINGTFELASGEAVPEYIMVKIKTSD